MRTARSSARATLASRARTQDSIAVTARDRWLLVNASPDVLRQIERFEPLHPRAARDTPIGAIALTNGDLDHVLGLLSLRESQPLKVLATERVRAGLVERNAMLRTLARTPDQVTWRDLEPGREIVLDEVGLGVTAMPAHGKLPVHLDGRDGASPRGQRRAPRARPRERAHPRRRDGGRIARRHRGHPREAPTRCSSTGRSGARTSSSRRVSARLARATWRTCPSAARRGASRRLREGRRVYTHVNNTNPVLREDSPERAAVERAGWEVAFDGMEIAL